MTLINFFKRFFLIFLVSSVFSLAGFWVVWNEDRKNDKSESLLLIKLSDSFNHIFSTVRSSETVVPATFRRMSFEEFNANDFGENKVKVMWPGRTGFEINRKSDDPYITQIINDYVSGIKAGSFYEQFYSDGKLIGRTVLPTIANDQSCVQCHNETLKKDVYKVGDVMGVSVVEKNMTDVFVTSLIYSVAVFFSVFLALWGLSNREKKRKIRVVQLESKIEIEQLKLSAEEKENFLLSHDSLTGLPNRKLFNDYFANIVKGPNRSKVHAALVDLDDFKSINDKMGHPAGDALLIEVARRLSDCFKNVESVVARLGGDEFAIIWLEDELSDSIAGLAENILKEMEEPFLYEGYEIYPKCSIGVSSWKNSKDGKPSEILKQADVALYVSKENGKNSCQAYNEFIDEKVRRRNVIAVELAKSIKSDSLRVLMQPLVSLSDGRFLGFEALSRWSLHGVDVRPDEFISVAESTGDIYELDLQVLRKSIIFSKTAKQELNFAVPISVNLSAQSIKSKALFNDVKNILVEEDFSAELLTLEVTETAAIENWDYVKEVLLRLNSIGISLAMDDFGTGYSSLAYLLKIKFDKIKVDREFIREIKLDNDNYKLLLHMSAMLKSLGTQLIIEGIETEKQYELIRKSVTGGGQGYFFSRPMELNKALEYLQDNKQS